MSDDNVGSPVDDVDPALLKVMGSKKTGREGKEYVKKLANAILKVISKHNIARLRAVGGAAVSNAYKALAIAEDKARQDGIELVENTQFCEVDFNGEIKTGFMKEVFKR